MLHLAFFFSGCAALLFETLWFRQAGLLLGNSVWASSLVLAGFMLGLCAGNAWAARHGSRLRRPVLAYAALEMLVGVAGLCLVLALPRLTGITAPLLRALAAHPLALNSARMTIALVLMAVPSMAMGMTLPLLALALSSRDLVFGRALGRLYGWNTLGAVLGALAGEWLLVPIMGLRAIGAVAALLNVLAAGLALVAARPWSGVATPGPITSGRPGRRAARLLLAAFLAGATLMALEVVWFRFLLLFFSGTNATFAVMLAVVLLGIALGGLAASVWLGTRPRADRYGAALAAMAGSLVGVCYSHFAAVLPARPGAIYDDAMILKLCLCLMLPVSWLSGMLFVMIGEALKAETGDAARVTGRLSLVNTAGAALGALAGGFLLIPLLGIESSFFLFGVGYGAIALLLLPGAVPGTPAQRRVVVGSALLAYLVLLALFPFGLMRNHYAKRVIATWAGSGYQVVGAREGLTESIVYLEKAFMGTPVSHRLVTNGFSMSATGVLGHRYMRLFVDWPRAVHPGARHALLISFGVGTTARALVDTGSLQSIDVVDISRDILEMGRVVFRGEPYPLDDPRVRVHVEDGRYFLATTDRRFDLITAEPPPPRNAGISTLYSREFFGLVKDRLAEGGITTYWLPVYQMTSHEARSVVAGFCAAFEDCSLWTGSGPEWMLVGTRNARGPVDEAAFSRPWLDPRTARPLADSGLEKPEQLGATFMADNADLRAWFRAEPPLDDDHPGRMSRFFPGLPSPFFAEYAAMMDTREARRRFEGSDLIRRLWPEGMRARTLAAFEGQRFVNAALWRYYSGPLEGGAGDLETLEEVLRGCDLRMPVLWLMASGAEDQHAASRALARGLHTPTLDLLQGIDAMASRDFRKAEAFLARGEPSTAGGQARQWRILARALSGDVPGAAALMESSAPWTARPGADLAEWAWLSRRFGLPRPPTVS